MGRLDQHNNSIFLSPKSSQNLATFETARKDFKRRDNKQQFVVVYFSAEAEQHLCATRRKRKM